MTEKTARSARPGSCFSCGQINGDWETRCQKCGRRLADGSTSSDSALTTATADPGSTTPGTAEPHSHRNGAKSAPPPPAFPDHLRRQLQDRVQHFRIRKDTGTPTLPFEEIPEPSPKVISFPEPIPQAEDKYRIPPARPRRQHHQDYSNQSSGTFRADSAAASQQPQTKLDFHRGALPDQVWRSRPVAPMRLRVAAHFWDLQWIAGAVLLFLGALLLIPYFDVSVQPHIGLLGGIVCGSLLLALLFALLFIWGAGFTPGMKRAGLCLVTFDGLPAPRRQRLWRIFGGLVSVGSFLIGFLWAVADDEKLYWHDHISKTYLTLTTS